jgi:predicted GNAT superfamily acetyltransferase
VATREQVKKAVAAAELAAHSAGVIVRELETVAESRQVEALFVEIWTLPELMAVPRELIRALQVYGGQVLGAWAGEELVGATIGFAGFLDGELQLHSHMTGVLESHAGAGVGLALKQAQRRWSLERGIELVTWTYDPLVGRNAHFNHRKLGAVATRFLENFYGDMYDRFNLGETSDRVEVRWRILDGRPRRRRKRVVELPDDYHALKRSDPQAAREVKARVIAELKAAFDDGLEIIDFRRGEGLHLA